MKKRGNFGLLVWEILTLALIFSQPVLASSRSKNNQTTTTGVSLSKNYDQILLNFYNYFDNLESNRQAKKDTEQLIALFPEEPYLYELWATIEWTLLGHELGLKLGENKDLSSLPIYQARAANYEQMIRKALALTVSVQEKTTRKLNAQAALRFERSKFLVRFSEGTGRLIKADEETRQGIKALGEILVDLPDFCPAYFFLGAIRHLLISGSEAWSIKRGLVRFGSKSYKTLGQLPIIQEDVFDEEETVRWLEKAFACGYQEWWFKKSWIENGFLLTEVYAKYRQKKDLVQELIILEKRELPLLIHLTNLFPANQGLSQKLKERQLREEILKKYLASRR